MNLIKETKLEYFSKYESDDNKPFWINCEPYLTNKNSSAGTDIMLSENGELILKNKEIVNISNYHFGFTVDNLGLDHCDDDFLKLTEGSDRIDNIIKRIKTTPASRTSKQSLTVFAVFLFSQFLLKRLRQLFKYEK